MTNHPAPLLSNRPQNARISARFVMGLVGPAGLKKACVHRATLICPTIPPAPTRIRGVPCVVSNLLAPDLRQQTEGRHPSSGGSND